MTEKEHREAVEAIRRACDAKVRKYESSRDYWKFTAITVFFISLFWILDLLGFFGD